LRYSADRLTSAADIGKADLALIEAAFAASSGAYAPNSGLHVGAAIRSKAGTIYKSANLENAAFDAVHAESSAMATARATEGDAFKLEAIAVVAKNAEGEQQPCSPCGACRQYLLEFSRTARVLFFFGDDLKLVCETPSTLLAYGFAFAR
jgi:cytidine deaminase